MSAPTTEPRDCKRCEGIGTTFSKGFTYTDSTTGRVTVYDDKTEVCYCCKGARQFPPLDIPAICAAIKGRKGLRTARPKYASTPEAHRAYYVWRMARFHGGADVTMPMGAMSECAYDPFQSELDILADAVARKVYGSDLNAARRWGRALGYDVPRGGNESASAQSGGPVLDFGAVKPEEELLELR